jgi:predicted nucleotidyltransferase
MAETKIEVMDLIKKVLKALNNNKIRIDEAYLFGSYANETNSKYSDIDIALVSDDFTGVRYFDTKKIGRIVRNIDCRIEFHTFSNSSKQESMFLEEIIRNGIKIA